MPWRVACRLHARRLAVPLLVYLQAAGACRLQVSPTHTPAPQFKSSSQLKRAGMSDVRASVSAAHACFFQHRQHHLLHYADMHGRASVYMRNGRLPAVFNNPELWPTHVLGKGWTRRALLTLLAQLFELPAHVPPHGWCAFKAMYLTDKCMVARKASVRLIMGCRCYPAAAGQHPTVDWHLG